MQKINNNRKFIASVIILLFLMTIYHNIYFDKIFSYYEDDGEKIYDLESDGWSVDIGSQYDMKSEFDQMFLVMKGIMKNIIMILPIIQNSIPIQLPKVSPQLW